MSLYWKIYHFFHHKFSKNLNKPPQMQRPVIRIHIQRKKNCAKKCLFWPPRGWEKMVIFHIWHLQKKIILISSHFVNEPWEPWKTLPNSHRSDLKQKIQNSKKFEFHNSLICHCAGKVIIFFTINSQKTRINHPRCSDLWSESIFREKQIVQKSAFLTTTGLGKNGNFSHMTPLEKNHSYFFAFCHWTLGSMKYTPK